MYRIKKETKKGDNNADVKTSLPLACIVLLVAVCWRGDDGAMQIGEGERGVNGSSRRFREDAWKGPKGGFGAPVSNFQPASAAGKIYELQ